MQGILAEDEVGIRDVQVEAEEDNWDFVHVGAEEGIRDVQVEAGEDNWDLDQAEAGEDTWAGE